MNYPMIRFVLSWVLKVEGLLMLLPCIISVVFGEREGIIYLGLAVAAMLLGELVSRFRPANKEIYQKEGFVAVGLSWLLMSCYGAIPFVLTREIPDYIDALFEVVSGFTTTGSTILADVEVISHTSLLWRSLTHWVGGMGVLVFILMLIPAQNGSHMNLMRAESPGPDVTKFVPRVRNTAILLYKIYLTLTVLQITLLLLSGMPWFDTVCITFGTAGTGGFGVLNASCATYTPLQQWIITFFMISFGMNFGFYYLCLCRKPGEAFRLEEIRCYLAIILTSVLVITWDTRILYNNPMQGFREAFFQVGSIMTTTGFSTADFALWPALSRTVLISLMIIGACAGSTGGGIKVSRLILAFKSLRLELYQTIHPRSVRKIRMDGRPVADVTLRSLYAYLVTYVLVFGVSVIIISFDEYSFETSFTAIAATLNNIGPGMDAVGPVENYLHFSVLSKAVMIFDMLAGRLELIPMLILFYPGTWKKH